MLDWMGKRINIVLSKRSVQLVQTKGWPRPEGRILASETLDEAADGYPALGSLLDGLLQQGALRGGSVNVLLADDLVRFWMVEPPGNASRLSDFESAAAMRFQALFDEPVEGWVISASIETRWPFLACAMPRALHDQVMSVMQRHRLTLLSMQPEFVALWNRWRPELKAGAWLGIWRGTSLGLGMSQGDGLYAMRQVAVPVEAMQDATWLQQQIQREALRLNLPLPQALGLCGRPPHPWVSRTATPVACSLLGSQSDALALFGVRG